MMKKRLFAMICVVMMMISMTACSSSPSSEDAAKGEGDTTETAENTPEATKEESGQEYTPEGTYNIRVFAAAGGIADTVTRITAQGLQDNYNVTTIVDNLTGASGAVAAADLDSYDPSINELAVVSMSLFTMAPLMNPDLDVSLDDYKTVASLVHDEFVLMVSKDSGIESWEDLVEYGQDNQIIYASNTPGGGTHVIQTALFGDAGLDAQALTSDGSNKDILAVMSGDAICTSSTVTLAESYVASGDMIPIGIFSNDVYTGFEGYEVPTVPSFGYDITMPSYNFIITRAGVDDTEVHGLYDAIQASRNTEGFKELAEKSQYTPDETDGETLKKEIEYYIDECKEIFDKYYQ